MVFYFIIHDYTGQIENIPFMQWYKFNSKLGNNIDKKSENDLYIPINVIDALVIENSLYIIYYIH